VTKKPSEYREFARLDKETEAILAEARLVIQREIPDQQQEFEKVFQKISNAAAEVRGQIILLTIMTVVWNLFVKGFSSKKYQFN